LDFGISYLTEICEGTTDKTSAAGGQMSNLLKLAAKLGIAYFILFSIFYIGRFIYALQSYMKYHSTTTGVDVAHTVLAGTIIFEKDVGLYPYPTLFISLAILALVGVGIWFYQFKWGEQTATVS
jgi:hypothetical protein